MKKVFYLIAVAGLVITSCAKTDNPNPNKGKTYSFEIGAERETDEDGLKVSEMQIMEENEQDIAPRFEFYENGRFVYTSYNGNTSEGSYKTGEVIEQGTGEDTGINMESVYSLTYDQPENIWAAFTRIEYNDVIYELEYKTDSGITCFIRENDFDTGWDEIRGKKLLN